MYTRQNIHFRFQRTNLINGSSVRSLMVFQNHLPNRLLFILVNGIRKNRKCFFILLKSLGKSLAQTGNILIPLLLLIRENGFLHLLRRHNLLHSFEEFLRNGGRLITVLLFSALCDNALKETDNLLVCLMGKVNRLNHLFFRKFIRSGFNHNHLFFCGGNRKEQVGNRLLSISGVQNKLPGNHADLCRCTGAVKGYIGDCCCKRRTKHRKKLRRSILINRKHRIVQEHIIPIVLRKERTHRTIDDSCRKNRMVTGSALSLFKSAGELSYRIHLLLILYGEGKEIDAVSRFLRCRTGGEHRRIAIVHEDRTVTLCTDSVHIDREGPSCQFHCITFIHKASFSFSSEAPKALKNLRVLFRPFFSDLGNLSEENGKWFLNQLIILEGR